MLIQIVCLKIFTDIFLPRYKNRFHDFSNIRTNKGSDSEILVPSKNYAFVAIPTDKDQSLNYSADSSLKLH